MCSMYIKLKLKLFLIHFCHFFEALTINGITFIMSFCPFLKVLLSISFFLKVSKVRGTCRLKVSNTLTLSALSTLSKVTKVPKVWTVFLLMTSDCHSMETRPGFCAGYRRVRVRVPIIVPG